MSSPIASLVLQQARLVPLERLDARDLSLKILPRWKIDGRNSASLNKHFPSLSIGVPVTVYHSLYTDKSFHVLNLGLRLLSQELPQAAGGDLTQRRYRKASS